MSGHIPAVRARHQKYPLARLPRDAGDDHGLFSTSVSTVINTFALPDHTIVNTEVITVLVPITPIGPIQSIIPIGQTTSPGTTSSATLNPAATSSSSSLPVTPTPSPTSTDSDPTSGLSSSSTLSANVPASSSTPASIPPLAAASPSDSVANSIHSAQSTQSSASAPTHASSGANSSATGALDVSGASTQSKGLSGGAIGGIVIAILIVGAIIAIYAVRKIFLRKRQNRRISWGVNAYPKPPFEEKFSEKPASFAALPPPVPVKPASPVSASLPSPPQISYNNPLPAASPITPPMSMRSGTTSPTLVPAAASAAVALSPAGNHAFVRCTFIPNLPDELSITMGEQIRVITEYDDGWALCQNVRGEQGVVPMECLDRGLSHLPSPGQYIGQGTGDWRMSRRASSLYATQNAAAATARY